ncbi:MAG: hypothetical protein FDZ69_09075 [Deltaproteobacteria bacterium]|nr:MAG: hypothetical protein FDZ69_09075 [Deltaproteobacteria bacterium]
MKALSLIFWPVLLLALAAVTWLARPVQDPDFFWHLKVGEWLWQRGSWPIPDPFSFVTPLELDARQLFIIKGYWLSQLLYFASHAVLGWPGIYLLRLAVFAVFAGILWLRRREDPWLWGSVGLVCLALIFDLYPVERPQFFSFLCFAWLYLLLDGFWRGATIPSRRHFWLVGIVMLLWGNLHGGFLLGQGLLLMTLALCLTNGFRRPGAASDPLLWRLAVVGLAAGCLNPNIARIVPVFFQTTQASDLMFAANDEFVSVLSAWRGSLRPVAMAYGAFVVLAGLALLAGVRRHSLFALLCLAGTGVYAALTIRYLPFFLVAALPVVVTGLTAASWHRRLRGPVLAAAVILVAGLLWNERGNLARIRAAGWVSNHDFPVEIAEQVAAAGVDGRLFNTYRWGGYLLWRLGPTRQVFVDGRALDAEACRDALTAEMVSFGGGRLIWREIFDKYGITYAILPLVEQGGPYLLTQAVARDSRWQVLSTSGNAVLLARR